MKISFLLFVCCISATTLFAQHDNVSWSKQDNVYNLKVTNSNEELLLTVSGDVRLTDDDSSIKNIPGDGYVDYQKGRRSLNVRPDANSRLVYTVDGKVKTTLSETDDLLIKDCVQAMISYGVDADNRVKRIYASGGSGGVLAEVERFKMDYVKEKYLSYLLKCGSLNKNEMAVLINEAGQYVSSDYYKSELMDEVMPVFLKDESTADAYLNVVSGIRSDYYQFATIKKLLGTTVSDRQFKQVAAIVRDMKSDYYQSEIIAVLLKNNPQNTARYAQAADLLQGIKSSYYKFFIIGKLIDENNKDAAVWSRLIRYTSTIGSDFYQSELLLKIARKMPQDETLKQELAAAAKGIKSDYYYGKFARVI